MSVVERALQKLRGTVPTRETPPAAPVAQTVVEPASSLQPGGERAATGRFDGKAAGRSINFDFTALAAAGLLAPGNERLADEYRGIKQPILRRATQPDSGASPDRDATDRLIMIASALPREGKTFTSVNLSLSLAQERDWSVLLVDTDCRNPSLSRLLGVADQPGLLDFLRSGSASFESFVLPTNIEGLYVLPLGTADPHAAELLASERMQSVCAALAAGEYGQFMTVFDSSPLLLTPEPVILGSQVGQIVLVVQANETARQAVAEALAKLHSTKTIGLVLNRASSADGLSSYSYGHSYGSYSSKPAE